ncbi:MAG TPA: SRPBCC domain-containing protein [Mycobacteriales bacterium]|nr:SRPBCC domain-containing protein [Mycobacteriales bacterium]
MSENYEDYQTRIVTTASPDVVFDALTTVDGLSAWWTSAAGDGTTGGELTFSFASTAQAVMRVDQADRQAGVHWTTTDCMMADWVGTSQHFELAPLPDGGTEVRFRHEGLTPRLECYGECKSGWDHFIPSLRAYLDTGVGDPNGSPADLARREAREKQLAAGTA